MPIVTIKNQEKTIEVAERSNLRKSLLKEKVELYYSINSVANCHGNGLCTSCRVEVDSEEGLTPRTKKEIAIFGEKGKARLSCQTAVIGDCTIDTKIAKDYGDFKRVLITNWAIFGGFGLIFVVVLGIMALDLVKLI